jgi:hypothetical protein
MMTYLRPRHARTPYEKGCEASKLSSLFEPIQRSGLNSQGEVKLSEDMHVAKGLVETTVYQILNLPDL